MMKLIPLPAFAGNDIWMLHLGAKALVVDPGDAAVVQAAPDAQGLGLAAILVTHHPAAHGSSGDTSRDRLTGPVEGHALEAIPQPVEPGNRDIGAHAARREAARARWQPAVPSTIGRESCITPYLRCGETAAVAQVREWGATNDDPAAAFAAPREWKNPVR
jgi:hypothetical protein